MKKLFMFDMGGVVTTTASLDSQIASFLGIELKAEPSIPDDKFLSSNLVYVRQGVFDHIEGFDSLISDGTIDSGFVMKSKGDYIDGDLRSSNRVAAFIVTGKDYFSMRSKISQAFSSIEVFDREGEPMINRAVYPF